MAIFNILQNIKKQCLVNALHVTVIGSVQFLQKADVLFICKLLCSVYPFTADQTLQKNPFGVVCGCMKPGSVDWHMLHCKMCTPHFPCTPHREMLQPWDIPYQPSPADKGHFVTC